MNLLKYLAKNTALSLAAGVVGLLLLPTLCSAQYYSDSRKVQFGFTLSPSISWFQPKDNRPEADGVRLGYSYGFLADIPFAENYFMGTGLQIAQSGGSLLYTTGTGYSISSNNTPGGRHQFRIQHAVVPLTLKLKTNEIKEVRYYGQFGTYLGINIGSRLKMPNAGVDRQRISSMMQPLNMGLLMGIGAEFPLEGKTRGTAGIHFENGFVDVTRNSRWNDGKVVVNNLVFKLGIFF